MMRDSKIGNIVREIVYFVGWGMFWGGWLGALAGTYIFPVLGTMFSVVWGLGLGIAFGIVAAFLAALLYPLQPIPEEATFYRRRLTLVVGVVTAIGAPILLLLTSFELVWGIDGSLSIYFMPSLWAASIFGGLAAAATASRYADNTAKSINRLDGFGGVTDTESYFMTHASKWWVFLVSATCIAFLGVNDFGALPDRYYPGKSSQTIFIEHFVGGLIGTGIVIVLLSLGIGALLGFLNRIYFVEYKSHWTMQRYRIAVMLIVGVGTLVMAGCWLYITHFMRDWLLFTGIGVVALYAAWLAWDYAEHFYEGLDKLKRKGKPKNEDDIELAQDMA